MAIAHDLIGRRFGRLEVLERRGKDARGVFWLLRCDCGAEIERRAADLQRSRRPPRSCGCIKLESNKGYRHGHASSAHGASPTYRSWSSARQRCEYPDGPSYANYGGRGISVCSRWQDFEAFLADMGERPVGTTLERIVNEKGYEPSNCRWATLLEQSLNRRTTIRVSLEGEEMSLKTYAAKVGIPHTSLWRSLKNGLTLEAAVDHLRLHARRTSGARSA